MHEHSAHHVNNDKANIRETDGHKIVGQFSLNSSIFFLIYSTDSEKMMYICSVLIRKET